MLEDLAQPPEVCDLTHHVSASTRVPVGGRNGRVFVVARGEEVFASSE